MTHLSDPRKTTEVWFHREKGGLKAIIAPVLAEQMHVGA